MRHNLTCFDNEAFRFLACCKNGVDLLSEKHLYVDSWEKSVDELDRMFKTISKLKPHNIRETTSLNESRRIIIATAKPIGEVANLIAIRQQMLNDNETSIVNLMNRKHGMVQMLNMKTVKLVSVNLDRPMTVCSEATCCKTVKVENLNIKEYTVKCHSPCYLKSIPTNTPEDPGIAGCGVMLSVYVYLYIFCFCILLINS